jgi:hypothetical protein
MKLEISGQRNLIKFLLSGMKARIKNFNADFNLIEKRDFFLSWQVAAMYKCALAL